MIANRKFEIGALFVAMMLASMVFVPATNAADNAAKENQDDTSVGEPWFEKGDELNRLSTDELRTLAEQNETVRKMLEEDQKLEPVQIESLKDLENLPDNYPEDKKSRNRKFYIKKH